MNREIEEKVGCPCGSGRERWALSDARGIFISYVCSSCEERIKGRYRIDVLENPNYDCDEPIEPEDY